MEARYAIIVLQSIIITASVNLSSSMTIGRGFIQWGEGEGKQTSKLPPEDLIQSI